MCSAGDHNDAPIRNEYFLPRVHSTIYFTSKSMCSAGDHNDAPIRNEYFLGGVH